MHKKSSKKKTSMKGRIVKGYIPPISKGFLVFDTFRKGMSDILKGNSGVYVLYKNKKLYYVGMAKDLFQRLHGHTKDKHKNKWDKFSAFIIARGSYLKDIESMIHRISNPSANIVLGKFKEHYQYDNRIKKMVKEVFRMVKKIQKDARK